MIQSYPGNIGNLIFPISAYPGNIGNRFFLIFWIFTKKTRAEISRKMVRFSRRDLSYETDSGPKPETDKTAIICDLAYDFYRDILLFRSQRHIFYHDILSI